MKPVMQDIFHSEFASEMQEVTEKTEWSGLDRDLVSKRRAHFQALKMNSATYVSSLTLHGYNNVIYTSLSLCYLECTTEGTEKGRSNPKDGEEVVAFKKTFARESVFPPCGSDDEVTKEDQKYLRKPGKQRK